MSAMKKKSEKRNYVVKALGRATMGYEKIYI